MPESPPPVAELTLLALAVAGAAWHWWNRVPTAPPSPPGGLLDDVLADQGRVQGLPAPSPPPLPDPPALPTATLLHRWSPGFSEPVFLDLASALARAARRSPQVVATAVAEGAADALAAQEAISPSSASSIDGPARLMDASADERWTVAEVERWELVQDPTGPSLRVERLRFRRPTEAPIVGLEVALQRLHAAEAEGRPLESADELGGWQLVAVLECEPLEPTPGAMRRLEGEPPPEVLEPATAGLSLLPRDEWPRLVDHVTSLGERSLKARLPGAPPGLLDADLSSAMRERVRFWQALAGPAPDREQLADARLVGVEEDACFLLARFDLEVEAPPLTRRERWTLGQRLQESSGQWTLLDISGAPVPGHPH